MRPRQNPQRVRPVRASAARARRLVILIIVCALVLPIASASAYPRPGRTFQVDLAPGGKQPRVFSCGLLGCPSASFNTVATMSRNGRYVVFNSYASDLVGGDTNLVSDIFRADLKTGRIIRVSVTSDGTQALDLGQILAPSSMHPSVSGDGRFVAFESSAVNLVFGDTNLNLDVFVHDTKTHRTERVSVATGGAQGDGDSLSPSISADGRYVAFQSSSRNFAKENGRGNQIFVHDRKTDKTTLVSVNSDEEVQDGLLTTLSIRPFISGNGRFVAFSSAATNLVPDDTNTLRDAFVRDRLKGRTWRVSVASDGTEGKHPTVVADGQAGSGVNGISTDGRFVTFSSIFTNLVPNDQNGGVDRSTGLDVFVHDLKTDRTRRVSVSSTGQESRSGQNQNGAMSSDGRYLGFLSSSSSFVSESGAADDDIFIYDATTGIIELVSRATDGKPQNCDVSGPFLGGPGRYATFVSCATNLRPAGARGSDDGIHHVFVRDRGETVFNGGPRAARSRPSVAGKRDFGRSGMLSGTDPSGDVAFPLDRLGADVVAAHVLHRPGLGDLFARIEVADMPFVSGLLPAAPVVYGLGITASDVRYEIRAIHTSGGSMIALYECAHDTCTRVRELEGGYGTTGMEVVFSVPLRALGLERGGEISAVTAYTGLGEHTARAVSITDSVSLSD